MQSRNFWTAGPTELNGRAITLGNNTCDYTLKLNHEIAFTSSFNFLGNTQEYISYYFAFKRNYRKFDPFLS